MKFGKNIFFLILLSSTSLCCFGDEGVSQHSGKMNEASGFVGTMNFNIGRLGAECASILKKNPKWADKVVDAWLLKNQKYFDVAINHTTNVAMKILDSKGDEEYFAFQMKLKDGMEKSSEELIEKSLSGTKKENKKYCKKLVSIVSSGAFDITESNEYYPVLNEMIDAERKL